MLCNYSHGVEHFQLERKNKSLWPIEAKDLWNNEYYEPAPIVNMCIMIIRRKDDMGRYLCPQKVCGYFIEDEIMEKAFI